MYEFELQDIHRRVPLDGGGEVAILSQLDASFVKGRLSAIIGPSGGGKSTLLRLLNRLDEPQSGQIIRRGRPLSSYPVRQLRRKVAFMPQRTTVFPGSLKENLLLSQAFCLAAPPDHSLSELSALLERVGLAPQLLERPASELSGGEKQRLALARLLLIRPEVLLLDEPSNGLDPPARERLGLLLRQQIEAGLTVILSSHDIGFVRQVADDFLFLSQGEIAVKGRIAELGRAQDPELQRFIATAGES